MPTETQEQFKRKNLTEIHFQFLDQPRTAVGLSSPPAFDERPDDLSASAVGLFGPVSVLASTSGLSAKPPLPGQVYMSTTGGFSKQKDQSFAYEQQQLPQHLYREQNVAASVSSFQPDRQFKGGIGYHKGRYSSLDMKGQPAQQPSTLGLGSPSQAQYVS